jgi:small subunit ribosomal protein S16
VAVKIKLKRLGKIRAPYYRIVVADARTKRDGRAIEEIGKYHPKAEPSFIEVDSERAQHWLSVGAQPTDPVRKILEITGDWQKFKGLPGEGTLRTAEPRPDRKAAFAAAVAENMAGTEAKPKTRAKAEPKTSTKADGKAEKTDGKAEKTDGKAEKTDGKAEKTDGKAEKTDGKAEKTDGKAEKTDGKAEKAPARARKSSAVADDSGAAKAEAEETTATESAENSAGDSAAEADGGS